MQPRALLPGCKIDVRLRPPARPVVFGTVKPRCSSARNASSCESWIRGAAVGRFARPARQRPDSCPPGSLALLLDQSTVRPASAASAAATRPVVPLQRINPLGHPHMRFQVQGCYGNGLEMNTFQFSARDVRAHFSNWCSCGVARATRHHRDSARAYSKPALVLVGTLEFSGSVVVTRPGGSLSTWRIPPRRSTPRYSGRPFCTPPQSHRRQCIPFVCSADGDAARLEALSYRCPRRMPYRAYGLAAPLRARCHRRQRFISAIWILMLPAGTRAAFSASCSASS